MKRLVSIVGCFLTAIGFGQVLPAERAVDWSLAGLKHEIPIPNVTVNFEDEGGVGDGVFVNNAVFYAILDAHIGDTLQVDFPAGTFFFDSTLHVPENVILNGAGADSTALLFDFGGSNGDLIRVSGHSTAVSTPVLNAINKGDASIEVAAVDSFQVGDWIQIKDNDLDNVVSDWAEYNTGQIVQIKAISGLELELDSPLRRNYSLADEPFIKRLKMTENTAIQHLKLKRLDNAEIGQSSNIHFFYAANCLVKCVESELTIFGHVRIDFSSNCEIRGSYFYDSHDFGGGGRGYGVVCQLTSGECLVQDNNFNNLRHAMLLQAGANGNVYAYNYSQNAFWDELPSNAAGDLVLHGNYVYANLFEGNIVQNLVIDHSHGINGPYNTFLRNRAELYGIFMNNSPASDSQNFIGNEIPNTGFLLGLYAFEGVDHFKYGNNHRGETKPEGTADLTDESYYLDDPLPYFEDYSAWPPIGYPNELEDYNNEAFNNFHQGYQTQCENLYLDVGLESLPTQSKDLVVYPNPTKGQAWIKSLQGGDIGELQLYDLAGNLIWEKRIGNSFQVIDLGELNSGIYILYNRDLHYYLVKY